MLEVAGSDVKSFSLDHLGLIAAIRKDLKIAERIDALLPVHEQHVVSSLFGHVAFGIALEHRLLGTLATLIPRASAFPESTSIPVPSTRSRPPFG